MNREVFCSCLMGSAVPLSYDLPSLPPFHSIHSSTTINFPSLLFSASCSLQNLLFLAPVPSTNASFQKGIFPNSHPCFVKLRDAHLYLQWLSSDFPYSTTSQPPLARLFTDVHSWRRNLNKLFSNGAAGPRFLFKYWWPQKEGWEECDGKISHFQSINAIACMQIISYHIRLDQTVWSRQYSSAG